MAGDCDTGPATACGFRRTSTNGGFTLVEVLAAVVLLSVGLLAIMTAVQASRETQQRAVYISVARSIAQSKIDEARTAPFDLLDQQVGTFVDPSLPPGNSISVAACLYTDSLGHTDPNLGQITVTVSWPEGQSTRSICYETLIANKN